MSVAETATLGAARTASASAVPPSRSRLVSLDAFRYIVRQRRFKKVPKILETPKGEDEKGRDLDAVNIDLLKSLQRN